MQNIMISPVSTRERITSLDILRGFALLGIILVNVLGFNASFFNFPGFYGSLPDPAQQKFYNTYISLTADKFIFMFSFLYGYGIYLQFRKFREQGRLYPRFMSRRMGMLALFGIAHIFFLWAGDILLMYAIAGMVILLIRKVPTRWQLAVSLFFYFFIAIWLALGVWISIPDAMISTCTNCLEQAKVTYAHGNYLECLQLRLQEYWAFRNNNTFYYLPKIMGVTLFGFMASKMELHKRVAEHTKRWILIWLLMVLIATVTYFGYAKIANPESRFAPAISMAGYEFMNIAIAGSYILFILLITTRRSILKALHPFALMGRMSLTNYLTQSVLLSILFYGWGFGLFGQTRVTLLVMIALCVYLLQIGINLVWFRHHEQGPLERLWRKISYKGI